MPKWMHGVLLLSLLFLAFAWGTRDLPEWKPGMGLILEWLCNLTIGYFVSYFFYIIVVFLPERKENINSATELALILEKIHADAKYYLKHINENKRDQDTLKFLRFIHETSHRTDLESAIALAKHHKIKSIIIQSTGYPDLYKYNTRPTTQSQTSYFNNIAQSINNIISTIIADKTLQQLPYSKHLIIAYGKKARARCRHTPN